MPSINVNQKIFDFWQKTKIEFGYQQKSHGDFVHYLLQISSLVKSFSNGLEELGKEDTVAEATTHVNSDYSVANGDDDLEILEPHATIVNDKVDAVSNNDSKKLTNRTNQE